MERRIQLRRTKGWRKPEGVISVDRRSKWGNPFPVAGPKDRRCLVRYGPKHLERFGREWDYEGRISAAGNRHDIWLAKDDITVTHVRFATPSEAVELFRLTLTEPTFGMRSASPSDGGRFTKFTVDDIRAELAGKTLGCWCPLGQPCHADILHEFANRD